MAVGGEGAGWRWCGVVLCCHLLLELPGLGFLPFVLLARGAYFLKGEEKGHVARLVEVDLVRLAHRVLNRLSTLRVVRWCAVVCTVGRGDRRRR